MQTVFKTILDTSLQVLCRQHWCRGLRQNRPNHTVCRNNFGSYLCNLESGIGAICKTSVFSKTSKRTSAWWLASNLRIIPLAKKCQINKLKSRATIRLLDWYPASQPKISTNSIYTEECCTPENSQLVILAQTQESICLSSSSQVIVGIRSLLAKFNIFQQLWASKRARNAFLLSAQGAIIQF